MAKLRTILAIVSLSACAAGASLADEAAPFSWTGRYVGIQGGYGWGNPDATVCASLSPPSCFPVGYPAIGDIERALKASDFSISGIVGGVHAGYDYQFSNGIVAGIEGDIEAAGVGGKESRDFGPFGFETRINWQSSLRARLGYGFDRTLVYATGGAALANSTYTVIGLSLGGATGQDRTTRSGWTVGAGVDYALTDRITARLEYRHSDFGRIHAYDLLPGGGTQSHHELNYNAVRVGVGYRF